MFQYESINASPVKGFFVEMLTRDISVEDAILDLLDNCVDGVLRSLSGDLPVEKPYEGFEASISVNKDLFQIEDNCGGIPWAEHDRAFRMGRPKVDGQGDENAPKTVGVYGIGMKRAIFKMGRSALIWTQNGTDAYEIPISNEWMQAQDEWELQVKATDSKLENGGTIIIINDLYPNISDHFNAEAFETNLINKIENHYSVIIQKGFKVKLNGKEVKSKPLVLRFATKKNDDDGTEVRPYMFKSEVDGVQVFLAVGLREPIPDVERTLAEQEGVNFSSDYAGWTIVCNDRIVLYCNRDELTGWGTARIPQYHTQFIAISGIVEFRGDPKNIPTTTTKRGLDYSSALYQQTLDRMREGMRMFIDFTNQWKTREDEAKAKVSPTPTISFSDVKSYAQTHAQEFSTVRVGLQGEQYKPKLPLPPRNAKDIRISYSRPKVDVMRLAEELLEDIDEFKERDVRRLVGEYSFDYTYNNLINRKAAKAIQPD